MYNNKDRGLLSPEMTEEEIEALFEEASIAYWESGASGEIDVSQDTWEQEWVDAEIRRAEKKDASQETWELSGIDEDILAAKENASRYEKFRQEYVKAKKQADDNMWTIQEMVASAIQTYACPDVGSLRLSEAMVDVYKDTLNKWAFPDVDDVRTAWKVRIGIKVFDVFLYEFKDGVYFTSSVYSEIKLEGELNE